QPAALLSPSHSLLDDPTSSTGTQDGVVPAGLVPLQWHGVDTLARADEWLVRFDGGTGTLGGQVHTIQNLLDSTDLQLVVDRQLGMDGLALIRTPDGMGYAQLQALQVLPGYEYVEPNIVDLRSIEETTPNDPQFSRDWGLKNTGQTGGTAGADIHA